MAAAAGGGSVATQSALSVGVSVRRGLRARGGPGSHFKDFTGV